MLNIYTVIHKFSAAFDCSTVFHGPFLFPILYFHIFSKND